MRQKNLYKTKSHLQAMSYDKIKPKVGLGKRRRRKGVTSTASPMVPRVAQAVPPIPPAHMKIATSLQSDASA